MLSLAKASLSPPLIDKSKSEKVNKGLIPEYISVSDEPDTDKINDYPLAPISEGQLFELELIDLTGYGGRL